jgi:hypothetical protein
LIFNLLIFGGFIMKTLNKKRSILSLIMVFSMMVLMVLPGTVFADDAPPAEEPAQEETAASQPMEEEVLPDPVVTVRPKEEDLADIIEVLNDADLVVVNESGKSIPLASEEAIQTLTDDSDPFYFDSALSAWVGYSETGVCAARVNLANCHTTSTPVQDAVNGAIAAGAVDIYIVTGVSKTFNEDLTLTAATSGFTLFAIKNAWDAEGAKASGTPTGSATLNSISMSSDAVLLNLFAPLIYVNVGASIQDGVDAVTNGGTVNVGPGTFEEEIDIISKDVAIHGSTGTVVQSPVNIGIDYTSSNTNRGIIYVNDAHVTINNLTVDGLSRGNANYRFVGISLHNASGTISNNTVLNITDTPFSGTQHGNAILVYNDDGTAREVNIFSNDVSNFQKNGITANGAGLTANISNNTVTGIGQTTTTAQNGIQLGWSATGSIIGNTVKDIWYTGSGWAASGFLLTDTTGTIAFMNNSVTNSDVGVYSYNTALASSGNYISGNDTGILVYSPGKSSTFQFETITDNDYISFWNYASAATTVRDSVFKNNGSYDFYDSAGTADAIYNYWGCDGGPGTAGCDDVFYALYDPWLMDPDSDAVYDSSDGTGGYVDNCPTTFNPDQLDTDRDGLGDVCDATPNGDGDGDSVDNLSDNCPTTFNPDQLDTDGDGLGDVCDPTPNGDDDRDGVDNHIDNCRDKVNPDQSDKDRDGIGDVCDPTPNGDNDADGVDNLADNCPQAYNPSQKDADKDGLGDACDPTPNYVVDFVPPAGAVAELPIPVTGAEKIELACTTDCVVLELPGGAKVEFCGLCGYSVSLAEETVDTLPFEMPEGVSMLLGLTINLFDKNGNLVEELPTGATLTLSFPMGTRVENLLGIQLWDPEKEEWVLLIDTLATDGQLEAKIDWPGTAILVE